MAKNVVYTIKSPIASADSSLPKLVRDPLLQGVLNNGVRFAADLSFGFSYPGGPFSGRAAPAAPANGAVIADISENANGLVNVAGGQTINYVGGGFDFGSLTAMDSALVIPASVAADIWTPYNGQSQLFLASIYVRLPSLADISNTNNNGSCLTFTAARGTAHPGLIDFLMFGNATAGSRNLQALRELTASTVETNTLAVNDADWGQVAQLSFARTATGRLFSLRTARARTTVTNAQGAANTNDFSSMQGFCGIQGGNWFPFANISTNTQRNYRMYRVFIENLARSGRNPLDVIEADWTRTAARNAFS